MYRIQRTENGCGPVAIWNAHIHITSKRPKTTLRRLHSVCKTNDMYGTYPWELSNQEVIQLSKRPTFNLQAILYRLERFILLYSFKHGDLKGAHYVFVVKHTTSITSSESKYMVYNDYDPVKDNYEHNEYTEVEFKRKFLRSECRPLGMDYPQAWVVTSTPR